MAARLIGATEVAMEGASMEKETASVRKTLTRMGGHLHDGMARAKEVANELSCGIDIKARVFMRRAVSERGQGTTEYAILVGVLVVIAIVAVTAFRGRLQELWNSIADGVNSL